MALTITYGHRQGPYMKSVVEGARDIINIMLADKEQNGKIIGPNGNVLSEIQD